MFTGIVSDIGTIIHAEGAEGLRRFRIASEYHPATIAVGASIACAGICLTVTHIGEVRQGSADHTPGAWFEVEAAAETLALTNAARWQVGSRLNLERSLRIGDELGGHLVSGHVDGLAPVVAREEVTPEAVNWGATLRLTLEAPAPLHRFVARKGSVALDGVSLTVNVVDGRRFSVLIIPHTLSVTTLGALKAGDTVHLEVDQMARYAARLAETAGG